MALYPESLLVGSSQIREPFLILFIAMTFWGVVDWQSNHRKVSLAWVGCGLVGGLVFSPGVAISALVVLGVWVWTRGNEHRIHLWWLAGAATVILVVIVFLGILVGGTLQAPSGPIANLVNWLRYSASYGAYVTELNSGHIQTIFQTLPEPLHLVFITAYGMLQPLLPAAIIDPAVWPMRLMGILRGLGWYSLLPLLLYSLLPIWKTVEKHERMAWLWLWGNVWFWIILCSFRAGGDQWDNPRYRLMQILFQSILAANCLIWARQTRDPWLVRFLAADTIFLIGITAWYISRYDVIPGVLSLGGTLLTVVLLSMFIFAGGWYFDWRKKGKITK
jgi:hypothetical protein